MSDVTSSRRPVRVVDPERDRVAIDRVAVTRGPGGSGSGRNGLSPGGARGRPSRDRPASIVGADARPLVLARSARGPLGADGAHPPEAERASAASRATGPGDRTSAWKSGEPLAGGYRSGGIGRPASKRSRTNQAIPPHSPAEASPIPIQRGSSGPSRTVGPGGKRLAKWSPWVLGRKPGTAFEFDHQRRSATP